MYIIGNIVYADAGYYLKRGSSIAFQFEFSDGIIEEEIILDDMHISNSLILYSNNNIAQSVINNGTYADYKKALIKKKYSNDDQIAIMLNKDSGEEIDLLAYDKMQEWREWASIVAKKILEVL
jgi:hypothetical protein